MAYGRNGGPALNISSKTFKVAGARETLDETSGFLGDFPPPARKLHRDRSGATALNVKAIMVRWPPGAFAVNDRGCG